MATLHLMIGLPGSGKTTRAKELELEKHALRLTPDEWHLLLFGDDAEEEAHDRRHTSIEQIMWGVAARVLQLGTDVILDFGCWVRSEREEFRHKAYELGADFKLYYMDVPLKELQRRLRERNRKAGEGSAFYISEENLKLWASLFEAPTEEELNF
jgi:predicted kinase